MSVIIPSRWFPGLPLLISSNTTKLTSQRELFAAFIYLIRLCSLVSYSVVLSSHNELLMGLQVVVMPGCTFIFFGLLGDQPASTCQILLSRQDRSWWDIIISACLIFWSLEHLLLLLDVISPSSALLGDEVSARQHTSLLWDELATYGLRLVHSGSSAVIFGIRSTINCIFGSVDKGLEIYLLLWGLQVVFLFDATLNVALAWNNWFSVLDGCGVPKRTQLWLLGPQWLSQLFNLGPPYLLTLLHWGPNTIFTDFPCGISSALQPCGPPPNCLPLPNS